MELTLMVQLWKLCHLEDKVPCSAALCSNCTQSLSGTVIFTCNYLAFCARSSCIGWAGWFFIFVFFNLGFSTSCWSSSHFIYLIWLWTLQRSVHAVAQLGWSFLVLFLFYSQLFLGFCLNFFWVGWGGVFFWVWWGWVGGGLQGKFLSICTQKKKKRPYKKYDILKLLYHHLTLTKNLRFSMIFLSRSKEYCMQAGAKAWCWKLGYRYTRAFWIYLSQIG